MNILHLHTFMNYSCGITRYLETLKNNPVRDYTVSVYCLGGDKSGILLERGVIQGILHSKNQKLTQLLLLPELLRIIKSEKTDLIHSHHRIFDFISSIAARISGIPSVMTVHSIVTGKKLLSYKADRLIAVSEAVKEHLVKYFSVAEKRIVVLPNGIDPSIYSSVHRRHDHGTVYLGFIGRLSLEKGIDILLGSCESLIASGVKFKLLVAGSGELENDVIRFQAKYPQYCDFRGNIADISEVYSQIDYLILPSRVDPFPFTMLECGFFNLPLIAAKVDGIAELIRDGVNGRLIQSNNVQMLTNAILRAVENPEESKKWGENLWQTVNAGFLIDRHISKLHEIYQALGKNGK